MCCATQPGGQHPVRTLLADTEGRHRGVDIGVLSNNIIIAPARCWLFLSLLLRITDQWAGSAVAAWNTVKRQHHYYYQCIAIICRRVTVPWRPENCRTGLWIVFCATDRETKSKCSFLPLLISIFI